MCRLERWSVRTLRDRVHSMMFERTAVSRLPEATIREDLQQLREADRLTPELVFRDPYLLDFLGLKIRSANATWKRPSCRNSRRFSWNWGRTSRSWRVRSG